VVHYQSVQNFNIIVTTFKINTSPNKNERHYFPSDTQHYCASCIQLVLCVK